MSKIYWAADSTVKENNFTTFPQTGMGQGLGLYLKKEVTICNHAENGRSTKSFLDESRLATIYNEIREGDFLFIQFGHNDEKREDPNRFTEAFGEYQENLERFVNAARNRKAIPVFITPLTRRLFADDSHLKDGIHEDYPEAMEQMAKRLDVPLIDLYTMSRELIESIGQEKSKTYFMNLEPGDYKNYPDGLEDNTHLQYEGAVAFAGLVAKGLKELGGIYADLLLDPDSLDK